MWFSLKSMRCIQCYQSQDPRCKRARTCGSADPGEMFFDRSVALWRDLQFSLLPAIVLEQLWKLLLECFYLRTITDQDVGIVGVV